MFLESFGLVALGAAFVLVLVILRERMTGFSAQRSEHYAQTTGEALDLKRDLNGAILCDGVIYGPMGRVVSRFVGDFEARWNGNDGMMIEKFKYDTGSMQSREWAIRMDENGTLRATAPDIVGEARGRQAGSAVFLKYKLRLEEDAGGHIVTVRDWMYRAPNGTIVNRSQFRFYGLKVAELVATMRRKDEM